MTASDFTTVLKPGLLVNVKTAIAGNVSYAKKELEAEQVTTDGTSKARWETERTIVDHVEHEAATKVRSKARAVVASVCFNSAFGLLCPEASAAELTKAVAEARKLAEDFNASAKVTRIRFFVIAGKIAADDVEAAKAIKNEVRELLNTMEDGVKKLDVETIRKAASDAKQLGQMLSPDAQASIQNAVEAVRKTARKITKAGESVAIEIDRQTLAAIKGARTSFLDLDDAREIGAPVVTGRAVDFAPDEDASESYDAARLEKTEA